MSSLGSTATRLSERKRGVSGVLSTKNGISIAKIEQIRAAQAKAQKPRDNQQIRALQEKYKRLQEHHDAIERHSGESARYGLSSMARELDALGKRIRDLQYGTSKARPKPENAAPKPPKPKTWTSDKQRKDALLAMAQGRTYVTNGQIHLKGHHPGDSYNERGPVAPWNQAAKKLYGSPVKAMEAAKAWHRTPEGILAHAEDRLLQKYESSGRGPARWVPRTEAELSTRERAELARWRSGDLSQPKPTPPHAGETPREALARIRANAARHNIWEHHGPGNLPHDVLPRPGTNRSTRLGRLERAADKRAARVESEDIGKKEGPAIKAELARRLADHIKRGDTVQLDKVMKEAEQKAAPALHAVRHMGWNSDAVREYGYVAEKGDVADRFAAQALRGALPGHDVVIRMGDSFRHGEHEVLVHAHIADVRPRQDRNYATQIVFTGPADNPRGPYMTDAVTGERVPDTYGHLFGEDGTGFREEVNRIGQMTISSKRTTVGTHAVADALHNERMGSNAVYKAFHEGKSAVIRRGVTIISPDNFWLKQGDMEAAKRYGARSFDYRAVTMKPVSWDGTHWTVEETYKGGGRTVTETEKYTPEQLERMARKEAYRDQGLVRFVEPKARSGGKSKSKASNE